MAEFLEVEQAIAHPGLRLVLSAGVPGPWGEAAKGIFHVKKLSYAPVRQVPGAPNEALARWTGQAGAPVAVYADEAPRSDWAQILFLAERLEPAPPLIPADPEERVAMFGLAREICGELGFGWCRRLMMLHAILAPGADVPEAAREMSRRLGGRYGYDQHLAESASSRAAAILRMLAARLRSQEQRGSPFFVGDRLSAADLYWAAFAALVEPLPEALCPMTQPMRAVYTARDPALREAAQGLLLEHRDRVYRDYLKLPLDF